MALVAVAALATMAFGASSAKADVFGSEFDNAYLKVGGLSGGLDICCATTMAPDIIELNGDITGTSFTVMPAGVFVPEFSGTPGGLAYLEVNLSALENVNGTVNPTDPANTTVTTTSSDFLATMLVDLTDPKDGADGDNCALGDPPGINDGGAPGVGEDTPDLELAFNTTQPYPSPYNGEPFTYVPGESTTDALDNGAIVATWPTLPAAIYTDPIGGPNDGPGDDCAIVNALTTGRGALWVASEVATPALNEAPATGGGTTTTPPKKKCKKGFKLKKGKCKKKKKKKK